MEFDRNFLEGIQKIPDGALAETIQALAGEMGVDPNLVQFYLKDMSKVKEAVSGLDKESFDKIRSVLGEEKADSVMENLRERMKGE